MFSRLTTLAATFAIFATASLAVASNVRHEMLEAPSVAKQVRVVQLERVVVTAKRLPSQAH